MADIHAMNRLQLLALAHRLGITAPQRRHTEEIRRAVARRLSVLRDAGMMLPEGLDPELVR